MRKTAGVEVADYIGQLRLEGPRLAAAAVAAGLDAATPSCPEWVVRDLVRHLGGVHRWATTIVSSHRREPWDVELEEVVGDWPSDATLMEWFLEGHAGLVRALCEADPLLECWTFLPARSPLMMWARRQAHETSVHRVDGELARDGPITSFPQAFAADGVDELLSCFITRRQRHSAARPDRTFRLRCTDAEGDWVVHVAPSGVETSSGPGSSDCEVAGRAMDLYLTLWNRRDPAGLSVDGDRDAFRDFLDGVHIRWS